MPRNWNWLGASLGLLLVSSTTHGQAPAPGSWAAGRRFYAGLEASLFVNQATQLAPGAAALTPAREVVAAPALLAGYQLSPTVALEIRAQDLPVVTGYRYERQTAGDYLGFGESYTQDYLYVPVLGVWRATGRQRRLGLSVLGGAGLAWTDTNASLLTPNGTTAFTTTSGTMPGTSATATQQLARQQGLLAVLEAGLRGTWQVLPRLGLDLSVRQLWGLSSSVRDIDLTIRAGTDYVATTQRTPVQGLCPGLAVRYQW